MPFWRKAGEVEAQIWLCDPLVVVHAVDGIVFTAKTNVECHPDDASGHTGRLRSIAASPQGWTPQLIFSQRIDPQASGDLRTNPRPGRILIGQDETGEPFTWYVNGEADRFLLSQRDRIPTSAFDAELVGRVVKTPVLPDGVVDTRVRLLHINREDGFCPFRGAAELRRSPVASSEVLEYVECRTVGEDDRFPSLFVLEEDVEKWGWTWTGIDADGIAATWYIDEAAERMIELLP